VEHLAEKLAPDITHHLIADPLHAVGTSVGAEAAHGHDRRDGQTNQNNRVDLWPGIERVKIRAHAHRIGSGAAKNRACYPGDRYREK
jgi:hypothetical protein